MYWKALSIDKEIKDYLAGGRAAGSTLAVFNSAVYLKTDGGSIIVVGRADIGNGPGFILLDRDCSLKSGRPAFYPDERFETGGGIVRVGGERIVIEVGQASGWDPAFVPQGMYRPAEMGVSMGAVRRMVEARGRGGLVPMVLEKVRVLADALAKDCELEVRLATRSLIGLGEGLTPSCDDLLVGLVGFMYGMSNDSSLGAYAKRTIVSLGGELASTEWRTTPIAAHFLAEAGRGRFTERVKNMLEAIFAADEKRMERASSRLIEYGSTSGIDLMCGMVLGYEVVKIVHSP
ncbi:MAG: DUF2877 domain-containing protein [bacterium]